MHTLTLTEILSAPSARVFQAWTNVDQMKRWFAPGDLRVPEAVADVRPGGRYRIVMERADGQQHIAAGEYREVVPNERLSFSWQWEGSDAITMVRDGRDAFPTSTGTFRHFETIDLRSPP